MSDHSSIEWTASIDDASVVIRKAARRMGHEGGGNRYNCGSIGYCDRCRLERLADQLHRIADDLRVREMPTVRA